MDKETVGGALWLSLMAAGGSALSVKSWGLLAAGFVLLLLIYLIIGQVNVNG